MRDSFSRTLQTTITFLVVAGILLLVLGNQGTVRMYWQGLQKLVVPEEQILSGSMIQQVKEAAESVVDHEVKITLLAERWDPRDAGLMW